jgi:hypothetical protein
MFFLVTRLATPAEIRLVRLVAHYRHHARRFPQRAMPAPKVARFAVADTILKAA